ncbi:carboxylate-amine ligase [Actinomadura verrucosospora]|uniref:Putative glutamate--cysteine ligase 2 n=1 Tax=Actinomadura verrucosospora TaxID=46165 RepID=A0A7D4A3X7_ACTVE|nr:glutamate--cysteine ligase [Actinomadura verrucosospora]QKG19807.1 glutamate--cysteine ligase GCS2 [Actinomadura verrucosospora]
MRAEAAGVQEPGLTVGVEEEFLLADAATGETAARADAVLARARSLPERRSGAQFHTELLGTQVEAASAVCTDLAALGRRLAAAREELAVCARREDALLISTGTAPLPGASTPTAEGERFARIQELYAGVVRDYEVSGCHVHVGVPDRETAVAVVNHLRPWLPTLLALSANSPYARGADTGYASWRTIQQARFPGSGLPPWFPSAAAHDRETARLAECGVVVDAAMSFWLARPSPHLPTVEVRAADAVPTPDEAVLQAALARGLVRTALAELAAGRTAPHAPDTQVGAAAVWAAARHGLSGQGVHPVLERRVPAARLASELLDHVAPSLEETGDLGRTRTLLGRVLDEGTGADHQRRAAARGMRGLVDALARRTTRGRDLGRMDGIGAGTAGEAPETAR